MYKLFVAVVLVTFSVCANAVVVDYTTVADGNSSSVSLGGTTVTGTRNAGSANVHSGLYFGNRGLGIGGANNLSLDFGEIMSIDFGTAVDAASLTLVDIAAPPGNVSFQFEAFDGVSSLGGPFVFPIATTAPETFDLFALSGVSQMTSFSISVLSFQPAFGLQIQSLSFSAVPFSAVPVPAAIWLFGTALVGLVGFSKRRKAA